MRSRSESLTWIALASATGFAVSATFSWALQWHRAAFLVPYVVAVAALAFWYFRVHPLPAARWTDAWQRGLPVFALAGFLLWRSIERQPTSVVPEGASLLFALAWYGVVYGAADALLLNVLPVLAVGGPPRGIGGSRFARLRQALVALAASIVVTVAYHAGYTECQGAGMLPPVIGAVIITSTYLLSGNPLVPVATHIAMHVLAVLHGMESTVQLPPHYGR